MLSRIMRSPFISTAMYLLAFVGIYLVKKNWDSGQFRNAVESGEPLTALNIFTLCYAAVFVLWVALVIIHNRKYPKDRISVWLGMSE